MNEGDTLIGGSEAIAIFLDEETARESRLCNETLAGCLPSCKTPRYHRNPSAFADTYSVPLRAGCIFHDVEENIDTTVSAAECSNNLDRMLRIEKELCLDATYNVLGILLARKKEIIEASNRNHSIAFHSFNHHLDDLTQLRQCRDVDLRVRGYRPPRSKITAELTDYNLTFLNFEWLASSASSLGFDACKLENGLVKIPIDLDDYPLFAGAVDYEDWENDLLERAATKKVFGFGLHDCYGGLWLANYPQLLHKLADIGDFVSADRVCDSVLLEDENATSEPVTEPGRRRPLMLRVADWLLPSSQ